MEGPFEFLVGAKGRVNRAQYWRSLVIFSVVGLFAAVILFAAAAIAAPRFIVMVILVFIPWLMWGLRYPHRTAPWPRHERVVAPGVLRGGAGSTRPLCESSMVCGKNGHVAALRPDVGKFCAHNAGIC
jgi:hypothetical protein